MPLCTALSSLNLATKVLACAVISAPPQVTTAVSPTAASTGGRIMDSTVGREPERIVVDGRWVKRCSFSWAVGAMLDFSLFSVNAPSRLTDRELSEDASVVNFARWA